MLYLAPAHPLLLLLTHPCSPARSQLERGSEVLLTVAELGRGSIFGLERRLPAALRQLAAAEARAARAGLRLRLRTTLTLGAVLDAMYSQLWMRCAAAMRLHDRFFASARPRRCAVATLRACHVTEL